jgi:hypothetical protein
MFNQLAIYNNRNNTNSFAFCGDSGAWVYSLTNGQASNNETIYGVITGGASVGVDSFTMMCTAEKLNNKYIIV